MDAWPPSPSSDAAVERFRVAVCVMLPEGSKRPVQSEVQSLCRSWGLQQKQDGVKRQLEELKGDFSHALLRQAKKLHKNWSF